MEPQIYQWENENSLRSFPFLEDTCLVDDSGKRLPDDIITDLGIYVQKNTLSLTDKTVNLRVSCVHVGPYLVSVSLVRGNSGVLSITCSKDDFEPWRPYMLTSIEEGYSGYITFGDFLWPDVAKTYYFSRYDTESHDIPQAQIDPHAIFSVGGPRVQKFVDTTNNNEATGFVEFVFPGVITRTITRMASGVGYYVDLNLKNNSALTGPCNALSTQQSIGNVCGVPLVTSLAGVRPNSSGTIMLRFK